MGGQARARAGGRLACRSVFAGLLAASLLACGQVPAPVLVRPPSGGGAASHGSPSGPGLPVLCVPGYLDLDAYFSPLRRSLRGVGRESQVLHVFPALGDIRLSAQRLAEEVARLRGDRDERLDLLAHSEGGLIARYYIRFLGGDRAVRKLVTLATPHSGTYVAYVGPGEAARQMRPHSSFLQELNAGDPSWGDVTYVSIRGGLDEIVVPHSSMILDGAENVFVRYVDHATIFTSPTVAGHVRRALASTD